MDWSLLLDKSILIFIIFLVSLGIAAYATYGERKIAAFLQDRVGPDRAGPFGLLQPIADGVKMFTKEEIIPTASDKFLFIIGPSIFMVTALMTSAVIPWGKSFNFGGHEFNLQVADLNVGILYIFAVVSIGGYGIMIGGWASNNKFALLGALRASSQMISYELSMGMSIIALLLMNGSLSLRDIVDGQMHGQWNVIYQPLGFLIFLICAFAECNRAPFDLPESESELVGGYHTEFSSMKLGLFLFAEYINMFVSSAIIIFFFIFFFMWVRWTLPRFRYDQLMNLGWKILIPLSIINVLLTGGFITFFK